jgi:CRP-like cAMP-binding protein
MTKAIRQLDAIEVLKSLNNAVHSRRIFPAGAPQIKIAQDRALSLLQLYLEENPLLALTRHDDEYLLSGNAIDRKILDGIPNLILYRQLELLQQPQLCLRAGFTEAELLSLFDLLAAKVEEIKKQGGGSEYIRAHGLEKFFPTAHLAQELSKTGHENSLAQPSGGHFLDKLPIRPEYFDYLLEKNNSARRAAQIAELMEQPEKGGKLLAGCLAILVHELLKKGQLRESHFFTTILRRALALAPEERQSEVLRAASDSLAELLPAKALAICFAQDHKLIAGARLRENLLRLTSLEKIGEVISLLRERLEKLKRQRGDDDLETRRIAQTLDELLLSDRGKQYLGHEKAKSLLASGELDRKKKRVQAGLAALKRGDLSLLDSEEMLAVLPWIVRHLVKEGRQRDVGGLLRRIASRIEQRDRPISPSFGHRLVEIVDNFRREKQGALMIQAIDPLLGCLVVLDDAPVCASISRALSDLMYICWKSGQMEKGDSILRVFAQIRDGKIAKSAAVLRGIIQSVDDGISQEMLENFLKKCLENSGDAAMDFRLVMLGPVAGRFLIERLMGSEKAGERLRIIDLLSCGLTYLPGIIMEKFPKPMPWYGKRNLLKLLAENGDLSHIEPVFDFLRHDDLRVQREAFLCLYKISGQRRRDTLLRVLSMASESIRLQAVKALLPYADDTVLAVARQIIDEREHYSPAVRDQLLINVCQLLARCPPGGSTVVLENFLELRDQKNGRGIGQAVWHEAENALKQQRQNLAEYKKLYAQARSQRKIAQRHLAKAMPALPSARLAFSNSDERTIPRLLAAGDQEEAERVFIEAINRLTQQTDTVQAQRLRQWFGQQQPDNLPAMIKAGGLISAATAASVEKSHLEIWAGFYDGLTTEEFTAFHQAISHRDYQDEEVIARQGEEQNSFYMINSGRVKAVHHNREGADALLQTLEGGELVGSGNFLDPAIWSATAVSVGPANLSQLDLNLLAVLEEQQPELTRKLREFCAGFTSVDDAFRKSGQERRNSTRYAVEGHVEMRPLDNAGKTLGVNYAGKLIDLSAQGLALRMRITSRREARQLLGRDASFAVAQEAEAPPALVADGKIVAVRELPGEEGEEIENSLHAVLREPIGEPRRLAEILKFLDKIKNS